MEQEQSCSFGGLCLDLSRRPVQCRLKSGVGDLLGFGQGLLLLFLLFKWRDKSKQYSPPKIGRGISTLKTERATYRNQDKKTRDVG